jgi:hypothetical protein
MIIEISLENAKTNIGKKVKKTAQLAKNKVEFLQPKPFKSKLQINTIKDVITHPILNLPAYTFIEDDSYVECRRCIIIN